MRTPHALVFTLAGVLLTLVSTQAQAASAGRQSIAPAATCAELASELATLRLEQADLQARLQRSIGGVEQNARNGQAIARGAIALNWATGIASLAPGVGFAASSAGASATQGAIAEQQRSTAAATEAVQSVVQRLGPLSQRIHGLETDMQTRTCAADAN